MVRDLLLFGKHRFSELEASRERIPTNLLAERLERLRAARLVSRRRYQEKPPRYEYHLTPRGRALGPVLQALASWSLGRAVIGPVGVTPAERDDP